MEQIQIQGKQHYTVEEFFVLLEQSEDKFEYHDGEIYMMSGGTPNHNIISLNTARRILEGLDDKDCICFNSDMKVNIARYRSYVFPDISVVCGSLQLTEGRNDTITNPVLIVEVLSPSTEGYDRGDKFKMYRSLPSLKEYVLISPNEPTVEVFWKQDDQHWLYQVFQGLDAKVPFQTIEHTIPLQSIYSKVQLDSNTLE